jgi:hypothetical protein
VKVLSWLLFHGFADIRISGNNFGLALKLGSSHEFNKDNIVINFRWLRFLSANTNAD